MLENSLCTSHLLFGVVIWGSEFLAVPMLHPSPYTSLAAQMQQVFLVLLCWALQILNDTHLEFLHLLANQPHIGMLVAKQLACYAKTIECELDEADC